MDLQDQFELEHLLFKDRQCRSCGEVKDLMSDFYLIRKNKRFLPSAYSYECKECTVSRILSKRKQKDLNTDWNYPDW